MASDRIKWMVELRELGSFYLAGANSDVMLPLSKAVILHTYLERLTVKQLAGLELFNPLRVYKDARMTEVSISETQSLLNWLTLSKELKKEANDGEVG